MANKILLSRMDHRLFLLVLFSIIASFLFAFRLFIKPTSSGLDPSFEWAFNYAAAKGLRWGEDFISTFGPYGYLIKTLDVGNLVTNYIIANFLWAIISGIAVAVYVYRYSLLRVSLQTILVLMLIIILSMQYGEYRWFILLILILLSAVNLPLKSSMAAFAIAGVLSGFYLLMKFSLGFGSLLTLVVACLLAWQPVLVACRLIIAFFAAFISLLLAWLARGGSPLRIVDYLVTGWEVTKGYSAAMSLSFAYWWVAVISFFLFLILILFWTLKQRNQKAWSSLVVLMVPLFIVWKHSIVRQDGHVISLTFFGLFVVAILIIPVIHTSHIFRVSSFVVVSIGLLIIISLSNPGVLEQWRWRIALVSPNTIAETFYQINHLEMYRRSLAQASSNMLQQVVLSDLLRDTISKSSIDIYPWDVSYVPANSLNWINRPLPASFNAYTPALDDLNAEFYESTTRRPQYILWHHDNGMNSIDGRHLFFDEPRTLRTIINNYDLIQQEGNISLLRVRKMARFTSTSQIEKVTVPWDTWLSVPQVRGLLTAEVSIKPSIIVKFVRSVFREGPIYIDMLFVNGEKFTFRLVPDNISSGLWINPFPVTVDEFRSLMTGGYARKVTAIKFRSGSVGRVSSDINISWTVRHL